MKKSPNRAETKTNNVIDFLDQAAECNINILALAELLAGYGASHRFEPSAISNTGSMILTEAKKLRDVLHKFSRERP